MLELMTSTVLLAFVSAACAALLRADALIVTRTAEQSATDEALRIASSVMNNELRAVTSTDVRGSGRDSLALRAFRGYGIVCSAVGARAVMRYHGLRSVDVDKDSMLITGDEQSIAFTASSAPRSVCAAHEDEEVIATTTPRPLRIGSLVLFFESGAYHLNANALRYRRGADGRQPLTDERIDDKYSSFTHPNAQSFSMQLRGVAYPNAQPSLVRTDMRLLNARP